MYEIGDLLESTRNMSRHVKKDIFASNCIDLDNVEKYYDLVVRLNDAYYPKPQTNWLAAFMIACTMIFKSFQKVYKNDVL